MATKLATHELELSRMSAWRELSSQVRIFVHGAEVRGNSQIVNYEVRSAPIKGPLADTRWVRWYSVELIDANGLRLVQQTGFPDVANDRTGTGNVSVRCEADPSRPPAKTLRLTVIEEMALLVVPFEYRDMLLE